MSFQITHQFWKNLIGNFNSGNNFRDSSIYQSTQEVLTNEASILFISNAKGLKEAADSFLSQDVLAEIMKSNPNKYAFSTQIVADDRFYHTHLAVNKLDGAKQAVLRHHCLP